MITWKRFGGYECSSHGDKRFSAFYAKLPDGKTIEYHYQCNVKGYASIREGKGKPPLRPCNTWDEYLKLWTMWAQNNSDLMYTLFGKVGPNGVLSDKFATTSTNQARALAHLLNNPQLWRK